MNGARLLLPALLVVLKPCNSTAEPPRLAGLTVTPHVRAEAMRYRRPPEPDLAARVQLFLQNPGTEPVVWHSAAAIRFDGRSPAQLLEQRQWAWHDTPSAHTNLTLTLPPGALTVWTFNGQTQRWGTGNRFVLELPGEGTEPPSRMAIGLDAPNLRLSAVTFLGASNQVQPNAMLFHVANDRDRPVRLWQCRLWLPETPGEWRVFKPQPWHPMLEAFPANAVIPAHDRGGARVRFDPLPLTYTVLEVDVEAGSEMVKLWAHLRIKRETFDISGGWIGGAIGGHSALTFEPYLKTLKRLHVNTGHIATTPGYTDNPDLYSRYPLKYFNKLEPLAAYDTDAILPRIHAVEFLGEPQYGGGRPVPPQEVWQQLVPYAPTRLPTTVTHSEERIWRSYAGLSDFAHYDAYRVTAPSPDAWAQYDRWPDGQRIRWGAPLETIGDMCRSLRELYRPAPTAYWSQGPHAGWDVYGGRRRTSPTPDELRLQAYHALASRITSLYWFNLSLKSLVMFRDTLDELGRVGREMRLLDDFFLEGDASHYRRIVTAGIPDWDLAAIASPRGALLFALDLDYLPDPKERVFRFGPPRAARWEFPLPAYLRQPRTVFRIDADGIHEVTHRTTHQGIEIEDLRNKVGIYVATPQIGLRAQLQQKLADLIAFENSVAFDPARNDTDFTALETVLRTR